MRKQVEARVIAEVGSNWRTLPDLKRSIRVAAQYGAWAVKFQTFSEKDMYGEGSRDNNLPLKLIPVLSEYCKDQGIEFMCTAFALDSLEAVNHEVNFHKVASSDITNFPLLERMDSFGKHVFLSTGSSTKEEIAEALKVFKKSLVTLMYCVSAYPSRTHDLEMINVLKSDFGRPVGFSDHSIDTFTPFAANKFYGCEYIEKHVNFAGVDGPDAPHSINEEQFSLMLDRMFVSHPRYSPQPEENSMVELHRRRWVATRDIKVGELFKVGENVASYRVKQKSHIPPAFNNIDGMPVRRRVSKGEAVSVAAI
jgi:sialic acid synthase SpsE